MVSKTDGNRITSSALWVNIDLYPERRNTWILYVNLFAFLHVSVALFYHHQVEKTSTQSENYAAEEVSTSSFNLDGRRGWVFEATARPGRCTGTHCTQANWTPSPVWTAAENFAPSGIRLPDHPSYSEMLFWLRYPRPPFSIPIYVQCFFF